MNERNTVTLVIRPEPTGPYADDPVRGLRWILKKLLRQHGWRCVELREGKPTGTDTEDEA